MKPPPEPTSPDDIESIFVISDLHTDHRDNLEWITSYCKGNAEPDDLPGPNDALIIVGDVSHKLSHIRQTLLIVKQNLNCRIFFIWGNHEAWVTKEDKEMDISLSTAKIQKIKRLCKSMDIYTDYKLLGKNHASPCFVIPMDSWYDSTLSFPGCEDLCTDLDQWPWMDFFVCKWPDREKLESMCKKKDPSVKIGTRDVGNVHLIPIGLTEWFRLQNEDSITKMKDEYQRWTNDERNRDKTNPGLISASHFLPNHQTLPDWKDPTTKVFPRHEWLNVPWAPTSTKFAKVSGSILIDEQIRDMNKDVQTILPEGSDPVTHLHLFGHSHQSKDFVFSGIRYIHNPLGAPKERWYHEDKRMKKIWDCRKEAKSDKDTSGSYTVSYTGGIGEIPGRRIPSGSAW